MLPYLTMGVCIGFIILDKWSEWYIERDDKQRAEQAQKLK